MSASDIRTPQPHTCRVEPRGYHRCAECLYNLSHTRGGVVSVESPCAALARERFPAVSDVPPRWWGVLPLWRVALDMLGLR